MEISGSPPPLQKLSGDRKEKHRAAVRRNHPARTDETSLLQTKAAGRKGEGMKGRMGREDGGGGRMLLARR